MWEWNQERAYDARVRCAPSIKLTSRLTKPPTQVDKRIPLARKERVPTSNNSISTFRQRSDSHRSDPWTQHNLDKQLNYESHNSTRSFNCVHYPCDGKSVKLFFDRVESLSSEQSRAENPEIDDLQYQSTLGWILPWPCRWFLFSPKKSRKNACDMSLEIWHKLTSILLIGSCRAREICIMPEHNSDVSSSR